MSRRAALAIGGAAAVTAATAGPVAATARPRTPPIAAGRTAGAGATGVDPVELSTATLAALQPEIAPRSAWAGELPVVGDIVAEEDVRFLLVHHTASRNDYGADEVVDQIREFYGFHTGAEKGWPDVAYNFFIDRFGGVWEARAGSIDGPVRGDATGGSQGFALLCSLIGDHSKVEVSDEALSSLVGLLAWLAERHGIDTAPEATVDFVSRGSNRWPEGTEVTTSTISGHRDMSQTACPGDFAYRLLPEAIPSMVEEARETAATAALASITVTAPEPTVSTTAPSSTVERSTSSTAIADGPGDELAGGPVDTNSDGALAILFGAGATLVAVLVAGAARFRRRAST